MSAKFTVEGSSAGAIKAIQDLNKLINGTEKEFEGAAKAATGLEAKAKQLLKSVEGPQDRYNRRLKETADLLDKGKLKKEEAERIAARLGVQLDKVGESGKQAFGGKVLASVAAFGSGMLSIGAIVGGVKQGLTELERQAQQTADRLMSALGSIGELQQVSASQEDFLANVAFARSLVSAGVVAPDEQSTAFDIASNLAGANFTAKEMELMKKVATNRTVAPGGLSEFGGAMRKVQTLFGAEEAGELDLVLDKVLVAGKIAQAEATPTAIAMTKFSGKARKLGLSDEEAFAALVTSENVAPSIDAAAQRMKSFFASVDKRGIGSGSLANILAAIGDRVNAGESVAEILGDSNAIDAYNDLTSQAALYQSSYQQFQNAQGMFAGSHYLPSDPRARSADLRAAAEGKLAMEIEERVAAIENLLNAAAADIKTTTGVHSYQAYRTYFSSGLADKLGMEEEWLRSRLHEDEKRRRGGRPLMSEEMRDEIEWYLARMADGIDRLNQKQSPTTTRQE